MNKIQDLFESKVAMDVLSFLADGAGKEYLNTEIIKNTKRSRMGVYLAMSYLKDKGLVNIEKRSNLTLYSVNFENPVVKQFKIMKNILFLQDLIKPLAGLSERIILFGSAARGEDRTDSDIDLFVQAENAEDVISEIKKFKSKRKIQEKVFGAVELSNMKNKDSIFYDEIMRGIVLWEKK